MRPSARNAETKRPSTLTSSSMMRESDGLGHHHVVEDVAASRPPASGARTAARSMPPLLEPVAAVAARSSSVGYSSAQRDLGEEAEAAEVHAQHGHRRWSSRWLAREQRAVAAQHHQRVGRVAATSRPEATPAAARAAPSSQRGRALLEADARRRARCSQATRSRSTAGRASRGRGRARMPTVLMRCTARRHHRFERVASASAGAARAQVQEELAVAFRCP